jgi:HlyD family secretion protein
VLLMFDAQRVNEDFMKFQNELDQANKELEKTSAQIALERQELTAKLAEAENNYEKLKLKQRVSSDIEASKNIELDMLAVEQAKREVEALKERLEWHKKSSDATYNIIASRKARAENKVAQINQGRERFQAKADRDGVVVYKTKWNGEKFQVGENIWSGQPILEIPDLNTIRAEAFVPEVDIGKIQLGQRAEVTIDAFPGKSYSGKVKHMDTLVRQKAWDIQNKILSVEIELDQLDPSVMRPAMSIKTRIETGAIANCLFVPLKAVKTTAAGALVKVRTETGWREQAVKLGEANATDVVILEGLKAGARVASDYAKVK